METQVATAYSERFEQIKARFRLKNRDLSRMAGVSDTAINKIISGVTESPDVRTLIALGKKLNLSADWLLYGEGPMTKDEAPNSDDTLKKGLQIRDELIAQLQKELWGKPEGAIEMPAPTGYAKFDKLFSEYWQAATGQPIPVAYHYLDESVESMVAPRFQLLETRH